MFALTRRVSFVAVLAVFGLAAPAAHADAMVDLVRRVGGETAPRAGRATASKTARQASKARKQRAAKGKHRAGRTARKALRARAGRPDARNPLRGVRLTAAQRGSGRVDVIDAGDGPLSLDARPAVTAKRGW